MKIKLTALVLSAILPLSVWAMPEQGQQGKQGQKAQQTQMNQQGQKNNTEWRKDKMQKRQAAWFERLELTAEQRQAFQEEMQQHREQQQKARTAHHDKLRTQLTDKQRAIFDEDIEKMQQGMRKRMHKSDKAPCSDNSKRTQRANTAE